METLVHLHHTLHDEARVGLSLHHCETKLKASGQREAFSQELIEALKLINDA